MYVYIYIYKIIEVNFSEFAYRLFYKDFSPLIRIMFQWLSAWYDLIIFFDTNIDWIVFTNLVCDDFHVCVCFFNLFCTYTSFSMDIIWNKSFYLILFVHVLAYYVT